MAVTSWQWYQREEGPGQMSDIVAHTRPAVAGVQAKADALAARAQSNLDTRAVHRTGDSKVGVAHKGDSIGGQRSKLDSYVYLYDPTDEWAATAIEFGWSKQKTDAAGEAEDATYGNDGLRVIADAIDTMVIRGRAEL